MEMKLLEGEEVVLDNGYVGYRQKLTLTNKRLVYSKKEGFFKTTWNVTEEIPLEQIEEAYTHTKGTLTQASSAMLRMKDGKIRELSVNFGGGDALGMLTAPDMAIRTKTLCDKWVNAINQQLRLKVEDQTETLEKRIRELEKKLKEKEK
jgi:CRISPR/Cas system-associated endonuclease Cas1